MAAAVTKLKQHPKVFMAYTFFYFGFWFTEVHLA